MFAVILCAVLIANARGLWFLDDNVDCLVSTWSEWSLSSVWQATSKTRTREILRHPVNDGQACPELQEVQNIGKDERLNFTATKMVDTFLSPRTGRQNGYKRDLVVIVDSSGSIGSSDFDIAKDELAMLLGFICPKGDPFSNDIHQAALIRYSNAPIEIFDFYAHQDTSKLQQSIRDMPYSGGSTCTGDAFNYVLTETFTPQKGMRNEPDVKHELLILTDGQSNCGRDATVEAIRLQDANIDVFGLMIGSLSQSGRSELETYVSDVETHLFSVDNFRDLTLLLNMVELVQQVVPCVSFDTGK